MNYFDISNKLFVKKKKYVFESTFSPNKKMWKKFGVSLFLFIYYSGKAGFITFPTELSYASGERERERKETDF